MSTLQPSTLRIPLGPLSHRIGWLLASVALFGLGACTVDLRPDRLASVAQPSQQDRLRGEELLQRAAQHHGAKHWAQVQNLQLEMTDTWYGLLGQMSNPWPEDAMEMTLTLRARSFDGRADLKNGEKKGWTWGLQSWNAYEVPPGKTPQRSENSDISFIIPALQYLIEFPYRTDRNNLVAYAGTTELHGQTYEQVLVTWNSLEPSLKHDQYLAFLHPETHRIERVAFTVRDAYRFVQGAVSYHNFRTFDGVLLPTTLAVTLDVEDTKEDALHVVNIHDVKINAVSADYFTFDPQWNTMRDQKPKQ